MRCERCYRVRACLCCGFSICFLSCSRFRSDFVWRICSLAGGELAGFSKTPLSLQRSTSWSGIASSSAAVGRASSSSSSSAQYHHQIRRKPFVAQPLACDDIGTPAWWFVVCLVCCWLIARVCDRTLREAIAVPRRWAVRSQLAAAESDRLRRRVERGSFVCCCVAESTECAIGFVVVSCSVRQVVTLLASHSLRFAMEVLFPLLFGTKIPSIMLLIVIDLSGC